MGEIIDYYEYLRGKVLAMPNIPEEVKQAAASVDAFTFCASIGLIYTDETEET